MKKIIHISDLHFGTENPLIIEKILLEINDIKPDLVVVSGDLTQRAKSQQYIAASDFLSKIPFPKIVVPGNHDISFWNLFRRFFNPLKRFKKYINDEEFPIFEDEEIVIVGVNSARSLTIKDGRISEDQIKQLKTIFCNIPEPRFKGIVIHHNLLPSTAVQSHKLLGRGEKLISELKNCGIDMIFSGHIHKYHSVDIQEYYAKSDSIIIAQAGTASSLRVRDEKNSYNFVQIYTDKFNIIVKRFDGVKFTDNDEITFNRSNVFR